MIKITLLLLYSLSAILFWGIHQMTPDPGTTSGNGNPGLLLAGLLIPLFILAVVVWVRIFRSRTISNRTYVFSIVAVLAHLIFAYLYRLNTLVEYRGIIEEVLFTKDGTVDIDYVMAITSGLSIHINHLNFSVNTFFMFISFTILIACLNVLVQRWEKE